MNQNGALIELERVETNRGEPLRGFWRTPQSKPGPCVSRPDLVQQRNKELKQ